MEHSMNDHGFHWTKCRKGMDASDVIQVGALLAAVIGAVMIIMAFAWLIITAGLLVLTARLYLVYRKGAAVNRLAAKGELIRQEQREHAVSLLAAQRAHELEVARIHASGASSGPSFDPLALAAVVAAAVAGAQQQVPQQLQAQIVRGEVER
jgi:hypothetical protein